MNGERSAKRHTLAFSRELTALIEYYRKRGQLTAFAVQRRGAELPEEAEKIHRALLAKLQGTIRDGPVLFAGGSRELRMFDYAKGQVIIAAPLWRELTLTGHWIKEALILRWAELVERISHRGVTVDHVIARLLVTPDNEREQSAARKVYEASTTLECVWTGRSLTRPRFDVDHAIPYSLWHNNDLWNLLPASSAVNAEKRDRIPESGLLRRRRDAILHCWKLTHDALPRRFEHEANAQIGSTRGGRQNVGSVDLAQLFERLLESAEVTALQRACPRWQPKT